MDRHNSILRRLEADLQDQVHHEAVEVPGKGSPFTCVEAEAEFWSVLDQVMLEDITPTGYGLLEEDVTQGVESTVEHIPIGRHGTQFVTVSLADPVWTRQAKTWCQALTILTLFDTDSAFDV